MEAAILSAASGFRKRTACPHRSGGITCPSGDDVTQKLETRVRILEAECDVLRAMAQGTPERRVWADGAEILKDYAFGDAHHQLIFDALRELSTDDPAIIRERLPAFLNNKGFPDVDLEAIFEPHKLSAAEAVALMRALRSRASGGAR